MSASTSKPVTLTECADAIRTLISASAAATQDVVNARVVAAEVAEMLDNLAPLMPDDGDHLAAVATVTLAGARAHSATITDNEYDEPVIVNGFNYASDLLANLTAPPSSARPTSGQLATVRHMRAAAERHQLLSSVVRASFPLHTDSTGDPDSVPRENDTTVIINPVNRTDIGPVTDLVDRMFGITWWANLRQQRPGSDETILGQPNPERFYFAQACADHHIAAAAIQTLGTHNNFQSDHILQVLQGVHGQHPIAATVIGRHLNPIIWIQFESAEAEPAAVRHQLATLIPDAHITIRHHGDPVGGPILSLYWP